MKIKVCGLNHLPSMNELEFFEGVDYLGFIFYPPSKRFLTANLPNSKGKKRVGVFVNEEEQSIKETALKYDLDVIQLHGSESPEFCHKIQKMLPVIKAFGIDASFNFESLSAYETTTDYFLFDTKTEHHGGSGESFDWNLLSKYQGTKPFFLSGGIRLQHAIELKKIEHPALVGLDINSGFEIAAGIKNTRLIHEFINYIR